ncbi:hypothetical protein AZI86_09065 [Bdellovibrio bacteriovorus]|uniref:Uncharacterized protein n=1 Tax=Bdellovibrio bacteriovorus TaxID=959 RepID=A0A150WRL5_BDEBC|nr:hypothetical protein AZI86_09065 [Bdellovibrio bacteriovorus]
MSVLAAASSGDDDSGSLSGGLQMGNGGSSGINFQSDVKIPGSGSHNDTSGQVQSARDCSSRASDTFDAAGCWGMTPEPKGSETSDAEEKKNSDKNADGKKDGSKSGDKAGSTADQDAAERAAALCRSQYQSARQSCESAISSAGGTCDSGSDAELNAAAAAAGKSQNTTSMVQLACSEAGGVSNSAKNALTGFRKRCSSAAESCSSACAELSSFLQNNPSCYSAIGLNQSSAQSLAQSKNASCESYQGKVSEADRAISNYGNTSAGAAACQMATLGGQSAGSAGAASVGILPFCQANPSYPGCSSAASLNCNDPSQSNNKICVCSRNPNDALCVGSLNAEHVSSFAGGSVDSSSRISNAANPNTGDLPDVPGLQHAPLPSGGDVQGIDGRQGGAGVGSSTVGSGGGLPKANPEPLDEEFLSGVGSAGGGRGGMLAYARMPSSSGNDGSSVGKKDSTDSKNQMPDLRRFLPGGFADPRGNNGMTGSVRIGVDGITGPHSNIWQKIQNRYQIIQGTLEP